MDMAMLGWSNICNIGGRGDIEAGRPAMLKIGLKPLHIRKKDQYVTLLQQILFK